MKNNKKYLLWKLTVTIFVATLFLNCGRKSRNIFSFDTKDTYKLNILSLPAPQNLQLKKKGNKNILTWNEITKTLVQLKPPSDKNNKDERPEVKLIGYNIYRFAHRAFIPNRPLNSKPISKTYFEDQPSKRYLWCYLVRGVFECLDKKYQGPTSLIVCALNEARNIF